MARLSIGLVVGIAIGVIAGAALGISAQSESDEPTPLPAATVVTAIRVGIDPLALHGAVLTTGAPDAVAYLQHEGVIPRPPPAVPEPRAFFPEPSRGVWDVLAGCESNGRWNISTGNGYYGGLQFDRQTWLAYGGGAFAPTANRATRAQQIAIAERLRSARGYQPWPACRRILRLP